MSVVISFRNNFSSGSCLIIAAIIIATNVRQTFRVYVLAHFGWAVVIYLAPFCNCLGQLVGWKGCTQNRYFDIMPMLHYSCYQKKKEKKRSNRCDKHSPCRQSTCLKWLSVYNDGNDKITIRAKCKLMKWIGCASVTFRLFKVCEWQCLKYICISSALRGNAKCHLY